MVAEINNTLARSTRVALAALVVGMAVSCATGSGSVKVARNAEISQNYDLAVAEYTKLLRANPDSRDAKQGLERAKLPVLHADETGFVGGHIELSARQIAEFEAALRIGHCGLRCRTPRKFSARCSKSILWRTDAQPFMLGVKFLDGMPPRERACYGRSMDRRAGELN